MAMVLNINTTQNKKFNFYKRFKYEHFIAGLSGGVISTFILHPLDLLKVRFAVHEGTTDVKHAHYKGIVNAFRVIYKEDGVRGLYRGVVPSCWGAGASWGLYFLFYDSIKSYMNEGDLTKPLKASQHLIAAVQAGTTTLCITNPLWVIKTRICLQYSNVNLPADKSYKGMLDCAKKIYIQDGLRGYYKGFVPGVLGVSHGAIQFMVYEELKKTYSKYYNVTHNSKLGTPEYLLFAAISKLCAASVTYPYQVVRSRLQDQHVDHGGLLNVVKKTWTNESYRGFYKGLLPSLLRVVPATAITFVVYENMSHYLLKASKPKNEI